MAAPEITAILADIDGCYRSTSAYLKEYLQAKHAV
jgi:hypothetical protein